MAKRLLAILIMSLFVLAGCSGDKQEAQTTTEQITTAKEAYIEVRKERSKVEAIEERLAITKEFLKEYPESDQTAYALSAVFYYQSERLKDTEGAIAYAEGIQGKIKDAAIGIEIDKELIRFYAESGLTGKMTALAQKLAAADDLSFDDHWNVIEGAVKAEEWKLAREYCASAKAQTTVEAFRADHSDTDYTEDKVQTAVNKRVGMLLVKDGWAQSNLGQLDRALADFAKADRLIPRYYFDIPDYDLDIYWGKTLLKKKDYQAAIDMFDMSALVMGHEEAKAGLKEAYTGLHGNEAGFEKYAADLHLKIAETVEDFEMPDYEGNRHRFADLRDEVTILTLWFPT